MSMSAHQRTALATVNARTGAKAGCACAHSLQAPCPRHTAYDPCPRAKVPGFQWWPAMVRNSSCCALAVLTCQCTPQRVTAAELHAAGCAAHIVAAAERLEKAASRKVVLFLGSDQLAAVPPDRFRAVTCEADLAQTTTSRALALKRAIEAARAALGGWCERLEEGDAVCYRRSDLVLVQATVQHSSPAALSLKLLEPEELVTVRAHHWLRIHPPSAARDGQKVRHTPVQAAAGTGDMPVQCGHAATPVALEVSDRARAGEPEPPSNIKAGSAVPSRVAAAPVGSSAEPASPAAPPGAGLVARGKSTRASGTEAQDGSPVRPLKRKRVTAAPRATQAETTEATLAGQPPVARRRRRGCEELSMLL